MLSLSKLLRPKTDRRIEIVRGALDPETLQTIETDVIRSGDNARADMEAARNACGRAKDICNSLHSEMSERSWKGREVGQAANRIAAILQREGEGLVADVMAEVRRLVEIGDEIGGGVDRAVASLDELGGTMHVLSISTMAASEEIDGMVSRFVAGMRQNQAGDRRGEDRYPVNVQVELIGPDGQGVPTRTVDLSRGGALLAAPAGFAASNGMPLTLSFGDMGRAEAIVTGVSALGIHCRFDASPEDRPGYLRLVAAIETDYYDRIERTTEVAAEVALAIEAAVSRGELTEIRVFDDAYVASSGGLKTVAGDTLAGLIEPTLRKLLVAEAASCLLVDRNGLVVADAVAHCTAWLSHRGKILADRPGIVAARSTRPFVLQPHSALGPEPREPLREISVPVRVFGRHWGALRLILADRQA